MDSLDGTPDFGKPEELPLVVPDLTPVKRVCAEKNKEGNPCRVHPLKDSEYCLGHAKRLKLWHHTPTIPGVKAPRGNTAKFKSREEILAMISKRLDMLEERYPEVTTPEVIEMFCDLCRTYGVIAKVEVAENTVLRGWRMKGTA